MSIMSNDFMLCFEFEGWENLCVLGSQEVDSSEGDMVVTEDFVRFVDEHFKWDTRLWVAMLDLCEMRGVVMYRTFDNVADFSKYFEGFKYRIENGSSVFVGEEDCIMVPERYVDMFQKITA